jgi:hypothetical protein
MFMRHPLQFFLPYFAFSILLGSVVNLAVASTIGSFVFDPANPALFPMAMLTQLLALIVVIAVVAFIVSTIIQGGVTHFTILRHRNAPATLGASFSHGITRILSLMGGAILYGLVILACFLAPIFLLILGFILLNLALLGLGFLALIVAVPVGIFLAIALSLYVPAVMMEPIGAVESLRRSWALTKGRRLSLFGAYLAIGLISLVVSFAISLPAGLLGDPIVNLVAQSIAQGLVGSWIAIAAAVAYDLIMSQPVFPSWAGPPVWPAAPPAGWGPASTAPPTSPPAPPPASPPGP